MGFVHNAKGRRSCVCRWKLALVMMIQTLVSQTAMWCEISQKSEFCLGTVSLDGKMEQLVVCECIARPLTRFEPAPLTNMFAHVLLPWDEIVGISKTNWKNGIPSALFNRCHPWWNQSHQRHLHRNWKKQNDKMKHKEKRAQGLLIVWWPTDPVCWSKRMSCRPAVCPLVLMAPGLLYSSITLRHDKTV